jgi:thiol-disulfide isomerase/thioredoxin
VNPLENIVDKPLLNRRKMLTYLGLSALSLGTTIACQSPQSRSAASTTAQAQTPPSGPPLPEFQGIDRWLNSAPLSVDDLKGSVTLIHIWTFGCINCQRTLPYVVQWHQQYANQGLKVVGIHSPEFAHERDINNVKQAIAKHGITYPNAIDNKFAMWKAYDNQYWPHLFLADRQGIIRYDHVGEGAYDTTEQTIQRLLG